VSHLLTPVNFPISLFARPEGDILVNKLSFLFRRHPQTKSKPPSSRVTLVSRARPPWFPYINSLTSFGISSASFCESPSRVTKTCPAAKSNPAAMAAVCPKFRRNITTCMSLLVAASTFKTLVVPGYVNNEELQSLFGRDISIIISSTVDYN
jgi:hypothetical protein